MIEEYMKKFRNLREDHDKTQQELQIIWVPPRLCMLAMNVVQTNFLSDISLHYANTIMFPLTIFSVFLLLFIQRSKIRFIVMPKTGNLRLIPQLY